MRVMGNSQCHGCLHDNTLRIAVMVFPSRGEAAVSLGAKKKIGSCLKGPFSITCTPSSSIPGRKFETVTEEFIVSISLVTNFYRGWTFPGSNILHLWDLSHTYFVGRSSSRLWHLAFWATSKRAQPNARAKEDVEKGGRGNNYLSSTRDVAMPSSSSSSCSPLGGNVGRFSLNPAPAAFARAPVHIIHLRASRLLSRAEIVASAMSPLHWKVSAVLSNPVD